MAARALAVGSIFYFCGAAAEAAAPLPPIVLVPGLIGSQFKARLTNVKAPHIVCRKTTKDWYSAWLAVSELVPIYKDCLLHNLELHFTNGTYHNTTGVELDTSVDFGGTGSIEALDPDLPSQTKYYSDLVKHFVSLGYERGVNIHGAPYDWRLAPDYLSSPGNYYDRLHALIEDTYARNGNQGVTLVAHSLGCPTSLMFLHTRPAGWTRKYIQGYVPIAGVWGGSVSMALALISGYTFGLPSLVPEDYLKQVQATAASGMFMMPTVASFRDESLVTTPSRTYSAGDWVDMLSDLRLKNQLGIFTKLDTSGLSVQEKTLPIPDVATVHVICGNGSKTPKSLAYGSDFVEGYDEKPAKIVWGDGDGIVNIESSLRAVREWEEQPGVTTHMFPNVSHFDMVTDERVWDIIGTVALGERLPELLMRLADAREAGQPSIRPSALRYGSSINARTVAVALAAVLGGAIHKRQTAAANALQVPQSAGEDLDWGAAEVAQVVEDAKTELGAMALVGLAVAGMRTMVQHNVQAMEKEARMMKTLDFTER